MESVCYVCLLSLDKDELGTLLTGENDSRETFAVCLLTSHDLPIELYPLNLDHGLCSKARDSRDYVFSSVFLNLFFFAFCHQTFMNCGLE